jgi:hypothetical protein
MRELTESCGRPGDAVGPLLLDPVPGRRRRNLALSRLDRNGEPDLGTHQVRHRRVASGGQRPFHCRDTLPGLAAPRTAFDVHTNLGGLLRKKRACSESSNLDCLRVASHVDQSREVGKLSLPSS